MNIINSFFRLRHVVYIIDIVLVIPVFFTAIISWIFSKIGIEKLTLSSKVFDSFGVMPIRDHYYQPLVFPSKHLKRGFDLKRHLPGIDFNIHGQLQLLKALDFRDELLEIPIESNQSNDFHFHNGSFEAGDSEMLFNIIRYFKPSKIIEIGSGNSTRVSLRAAKLNKSENQITDILCIEPYQQPWLESVSEINVIRKKVEDVPFAEFESLKENDILFIDSSHMIRPNGDILFEFLELLPKLNRGVLVHVHDIYSPRDYSEEIIFDKRFMWNEQYLLEAFLSFNDHFEIICSLNYLKRNYYKEISTACPILEQEPNADPASFWIRKVK